MKGFVGLLTVLFIGLKLTGYIGWSWVWVFSPSIVMIGAVMMGVVLAVLVKR